MLRTPASGADASDAWFVVFRSARSSAAVRLTRRRLNCWSVIQLIMATDDTAIANGAAMPDSGVRTRMEVS